MDILKIQSFPNGAHDNVNIDTSPVPYGWCLLPNGIENLENFPFGNIITKEGIGPAGDACQILDTWEPKDIPVPPEPEPEPAPVPTEEEKLRAQVLYTAVMTDTLLEEEEEPEE